MTRLTRNLVLALWIAATAAGCAASRTEQGGTNTNWLSCNVDADCAALPGARCEDERCVTPPGDDGGQGGSTFAPEKGPAHGLALPVQSERAVRYVDGDDTWRYVAPENPGRIYDVAFFDGRYYMLHGEIENSQKVTVSEVNWLSSTADGLDWVTTTLTMTPRESYTRLASDGRSLLLAGLRHVARLVDDKVEPYAALEQDTAPPVLVGFPGGYAVGRFDDALLIDRQNTVASVLHLELAQFRAGVFADERLLLVGPFAAVTSTDGRSFRTLAPPCNGCGPLSLTHGNGTHLAASPDTLFTSTDGEHWQAQGWERPAPELDAPGESIARVDFTGGHFTLLTGEGNTFLSADGVTWTDQLKIPLEQIGPAACDGRCIVAGGRLLLPPRVVR